MKVHQPVEGEAVDAVTALSTLGANVFRLRVLRIPKMSREELAERSGVSYNTIAGIEAARDPERARVTSQPQLDTIEELALALGVDVAELLTTRVKRDGEPARLRSLPDIGPPPALKVPRTPRVPSQGRVWVQET